MALEKYNLIALFKKTMSRKKSEYEWDFERVMTTIEDGEHKEGDCTLSAIIINL